MSAKVLKKLRPLNSAVGKIKILLFALQPKQISSQKGKKISLDELKKLWDPEIKVLNTFKEHCSGIEFWFLCPKSVVIIGKDIDEHTILELIDEDNTLIGLNKKVIKFDIDFSLVLRQFLSAMNFKFLKGPKYSQTLQSANQEFFSERLWSPTDWIQDPFLVLQDQSGDPVIVESYYPWTRLFAYIGNNSNARIASEIVNTFLPELISSNTSILSKSTKYFFQGGNVVNGNDFVFVGMDLLRRNIVNYPNDPDNRNLLESSKQVLAGLKEAFSCREVVCPGLVLNKKFDSFARQPHGLKHLDQFLVYGGLQKQPRNTYLVLLGEMYHWNQIEWVRTDEEDSGRQVYLTKIESWLKQPEKFGHSFKFGFEIKKIPIFEFKGELWYSPNCHIQIVGNSRKAFVAQNFSPKAGDQEERKAADDRTVEMFEAAGFTVIALPSISLIRATTEHSGLHCLTKVLARG